MNVIVCILWCNGDVRIFSFSSAIKPSQILNKIANFLIVYYTEWKDATCNIFDKIYLCNYAVSHIIIQHKKSEIFSIAL